MPSFVQLLCRTSTTSGNALNLSITVSRYSRFALVFLNDIGNCASSAPSMPSTAIDSSPSLASRSSSAVARIVSAEVLSITAIGECVKALLSLAVN